MRLRGRRGLLAMKPGRVRRCHAPTYLARRVRLRERARHVVRTILIHKEKLAQKTHPVRARNHLPRTERLLRTESLLLPMARRNVHIEQRIRFDSEKRVVVIVTWRFFSVSDLSVIATIV